MSLSLVDVRDRVRLLTGDVDPGRPAVGTLRMNAMIEGRLIEFSGRTFRHDEAVQTVTLVASTYDYTLTGETFGVQEVLRNSDGYALRRQTMEYMNEHYRQDTSSPVASANLPVDYAIFELAGTTASAVQRTRIRVGPTPNASGSLKVWSNVIPALLTMYNYYGDDNVTEVGLGDNLSPGAANGDGLFIVALVHAVAGDCVLSMPEEERKRLAISTQIVPVWQRISDNALKGHNWRMRLNSAQSHVEQVTP